MGRLGQLLGVTTMLLVAGAVHAAAKDAPNTLTAAEKKAGWKLLFDGKTTEGWRGFNRPAMPDKGWGVRDGSLGRIREPGEKGGPGDIITVEQFDNFELKLDYKVTAGGNSGVKYLVDEAMVKNGGHSGLGFEYQIIDDAGHADAQAGSGGNHSCGALYDLIPPAKDKKVNPPGQWNEVRLLVEGNRVQHWLNGVKVVEFERGGPELKALIAKSKFKNTAGFGEVAKGHILLQDHPGEVAFRNIKIRPLRIAAGKK
jgi:hypothetical protein